MILINALWLKKGDILFAMIGTVGFPVIVDTNTDLPLKMLLYSNLKIIIF